MEQQRERAKYASKDQDKEQKRATTSSTGGFQMHSHEN